MGGPQKECLCVLAEALNQASADTDSTVLTLLSTTTKLVESLSKDDVQKVSNILAHSICKPSLSCPSFRAVCFEKG